MPPKKSLLKTPKAWTAIAAVAGLALALVSLTGARSASALAAIASPHAAHPGLNLRLAEDDGSPAQPGPLFTAALQGSPEARLLAAYQLMAQGELDAALQAAQALERDVPNFKLAQLLKADLLQARQGGRPAMGGEPSGVNADALAQLRDEARQRLHALQERPAPGSLPLELVQLPPSVSHAVAVDTSRSRLYVFENSADGLRLVEDFYVSVGKQGVDKQVEGDQRTPLGVYFTTGQLAAGQLEDRFGAGALPLNYPNAWDKAKGRTGSGILLHGVPSNTYSRPPLDSDGCVAMANEDLQRLAARLPKRQTPVVITRSLHWAAPEQIGRAVPGSFLAAAQRWQQARLNGQADAALALYGDPSKVPDPGTLQSLKLGAERAPATIEDISVFSWQDEGQAQMVVTFRELGTDKARSERVLRQYWRPQGQDDWRIVAEGQVR